MGVTIKCQKTKRDIDMGYFSFADLRRQIAYCESKELGDLYNEAMDMSKRIMIPDPSNYWDEYDRRLDQLIKSGGISVKVVDFLYQSDCEGKINRRQCKKILERIKDLPDEQKIGYKGREDCATMGDFKDILRDCVNKKCEMEWW